MADSKQSTFLRRYPKTQGGFTLVEIMVVVAILSALATIAVPSYIRAREFSVLGQISNNLKVYREAVDIYSTEKSKYPADAASGIFPDELKDSQYLEPGVYNRFDNGQTLPLIGGYYDWDNLGAAGVSYQVAIAIADTISDDSLLETIDKNLDDGNLSSGNVFKQGNSLIYVIE